MVFGTNSVAIVGFSLTNRWMTARRATEVGLALLLVPLAGIGGRGSIPWGVVLLIAVGIAAITGAVGLRRVGRGARPKSDSIPGRLDQ